MVALGNVLEDFINSRAGMALGLALSRMPPRAGYKVAQVLGRQIAAMKNNPMVRNVRANQWVIHNECLSVRELDEAVVATFQSTIRSLYEFWHFFRDAQAVKNMVELDPSFTDCFEHSRQTHTGLLMIVPHLSNFDMVGASVQWVSFTYSVLSAAARRVSLAKRPAGDARTERNPPHRRGFTGSIYNAPFGRHSLVTGADRPLPELESKYQPRFFGRAANLPVFYIRLALKHHLPIVVTGMFRKPDGRYLVVSSDPIPMIPHPDLVQETVQNAEFVLAVVASFIQREKDQWAMFYPVWPEILADMPV